MEAEEEFTDAEWSDVLLFVYFPTPPDPILLLILSLCLHMLVLIALLHPTLMLHILTPTAPPPGGKRPNSGLRPPHLHRSKMVKCHVTYFQKLL